MKYIFRNKLYQGTRTEIVDQLVVDLRDLLGYQPYDIHKLLKDIPETFDIEIGIDTFRGTKEEILEQFMANIRGVDVIFKYNNQFDLLGICIFGYPGETISTIRSRIIKKVRRIIDEF